MRNLVLATSLRYFHNHIKDRFSPAEIQKFSLNSGLVVMKNGDEYIYINGPQKLRGYHGVDVHMWSLPSWWTYECEQLVQIAKLK